MLNQNIYCSVQTIYFQFIFSAIGSFMFNKTVCVAVYTIYLTTAN